MTTPTDTIPVALDQLEVDRVDAVAGPANGIPFLIVKALAEQPSRAAATASLRPRKATPPKPAPKAPHRTRMTDPFPGALSYRGRR